MQIPRRPRTCLVSQLCPVPRRPGRRSRGRAVAFVQSSSWWQPGGEAAAPHRPAPCPVARLSRVCLSARDRRPGPAAARPRRCALTLAAARGRALAELPSWWLWVDRRGGITPPSPRASPLAATQTRRLGAPGPKSVISTCDEDTGSQGLASGPYPRPPRGAEGGAEATASPGAGTWIGLATTLKQDRLERECR